MLIHGDRQSCHRTAIEYRHVTTTEDSLGTFSIDKVIVADRRLLEASIVELSLSIDVFPWDHDN